MEGRPEVRVTAEVAHVREHVHCRLERLLGDATAGRLECHHEKIVRGPDVGAAVEHGVRGSGSERKRFRDARCGLAGVIEQVGHVAELTGGAEVGRLRQPASTVHGFGAEVGGPDQCTRARCADRHDRAPARGFLEPLRDAFIRLDGRGGEMPDVAVGVGREHLASQLRVRHSAKVACSTTAARMIG